MDGAFQEVVTAILATKGQTVYKVRYHSRYHTTNHVSIVSHFFFPSMQQLAQTIVITQLARAAVTKSGRDASVMTLGRDQIAVSVMQMPVLMVTRLAIHIE